MGVVGVLKLVYQNILEVLFVFLADFRIFEEQLEGVEQQVVKVHGVGLPASRHVGCIYLVHFRQVVGCITAYGRTVRTVLLGHNQPVLGG